MGYKALHVLCAAKPQFKKIVFGALAFLIGRSLAIWAGYLPNRAIWDWYVVMYFIIFYGVVVFLQSYLEKRKIKSFQD